jgi:hypothetical protein
MSGHTKGKLIQRGPGRFHLEGEEKPREYPAHGVIVDQDDQGRRRTSFVFTCESTTLDNDANARRIVQCWNSHDALVVALKTCLVVARDPEMSFNAEGIKRLEATLKLAEEGSND